MRETSRAALASIDLARGKRLVLDYLVSRDAEGSTDEEGQLALGVGPNSFRPRRIELVEAGFVVDSGRTRKTKSGRRAVVWTASSVRVDKSSAPAPAPSSSPAASSVPTVDLVLVDLVPARVAAREAWCPNCRFSIGLDLDGRGECSECGAEARRYAGGSR